MEDLQRREKVQKRDQERRTQSICLSVWDCVCVLCVVVEHTFPSLLPANVAS